jgi:hypothetical protein
MTPRAVAAFARVFALEVDGKPTLAFEARTVRQAQELCKESWLHDDLISLRSGGDLLYTAQSKLSVRTATAEEAAIFNQASDAAKPSDELVLAYLVELDGG